MKTVSERDNAESFSETTNRCGLLIPVEWAHAGFIETCRIVGSINKKSWNYMYNRVKQKNIQEYRMFHDDWTIVVNVHNKIV